MMDADLADVATRSTVTRAEPGQHGPARLLRFLKRFSRRTRVAGSLAVTDALIAGSALIFADVVAGLFGGSTVDTVGYAAPIALVLGLHLTLGLYSGVGPGPFERFRLRAVAALFILAASLIIASVSAGFLAHAAGACAGAAFFLTAGFYAGAGVRNLLLKARLWGAPSLLVGQPDEVERVRRLLRAAPELGLRPVGSIAAIDGHDANGSKAAWDEFVRASRRAEVALFFSADALRHVNSMLGNDTGPRLMLVSDATDMQALGLRPRSLGDVVATEIHRDLLGRHSQALKRAFDIFLTIPLALLAVPVIAILAIVIRFYDPGPALFVHERIGRGGRAFDVYKLRSMFVDAEARLESHLTQNEDAQEEWNRHFKLRDDPRVLPIIGSFVRRTSLDELPQIWNVLRGDMSLVGPRPFPAYHVAEFDDDFRRLRGKVPPGLTGLWQISSRSDGDIATQRSEDLYYIHNWSVWLDLFILLQTLPAVIFGRGAR